MNEETRLRALEAINSLQFAVYAMRDGQWARARELARDVLLIIDATPERDRHAETPEEPEHEHLPEEPELDSIWRGELTDMDNPLNQPAREY
jgi:hypothetical protein